MAAWKIIKGWLPPKFVDRVKFVDKKTIKEWIEPDNQLAEWGGSDNYVYKFEPETRQKRTMANGRGPPDPKPRKMVLILSIKKWEKSPSEGDRKLQPN
ncbi:CRAL-TRIO domain-containing protein C3H8.02 [Orchesella cincta]|uniref:CRAL-TRIO domain-containing protein C3H8.02 n=1 Tax=Orchesella cincta TaxID=48709 RepID=A0A1D2MJS1_ORCCI|nr:CRAL-TRIO domain-containing protein C3H8.02 [Orchesella cincta]